MDVTLTYSQYHLKCFPALIAACSKNVTLVKSENSSNTPSIAPGCPQITNSSSIICFILNHDPLDEGLYEDILFIEKYVEPILYNFYKNEKAINDKKALEDIQKVIKIIETRFKDIFTGNVFNAPSLTLWSVLYLLLNNAKSYKNIAVSDAVKNWFDNLSTEKCINRALKIVFDDELSLESIKKVVLNLPSQTICEILLEGSVNQKKSADFKSVLDTFLNGHVSLKKPVDVSVPRLPRKDMKNVLITAALPYINNVPHLGNLIGSTLSGDFYSRYCRLRGWNSVYISGTDEYGTATEIKALQEKCSPREICDKYHALHRDVYKWFGIEFDLFGRTSEHPNHTEMVQQMFRDVSANGYIMQDSVQQLLCEQCDRFLVDRFVEGVCPCCGYEDARGDQCDECGKLVNAVELKRPKCKMCNNEPVVKESRHFFLELEKLKEKLITYTEERSQSWSSSAKGITKSWLLEDLQPRCITRDLKWGIKVPKEGFEEKVFYTWFDVVISYISITSKYTDQWKQWWLPDPENKVTLVQFMAKDNVPFHSIIFPAILHASNKPYLLPDTIAATEYLNYENTKFSKSRGVGVFGSDVISLEHQTQTITATNQTQNFHLHPDLWRFYLAVSRPESQDSSFMWDDFVLRLNTELLDNLGNFVNRAFSFIVNKFDGVIPENWTEQIRPEEDAEFLDNVNEELEKYCVFMDQMKIRDAVAVILNISRHGNFYLQQYAPWKLLKTAGSDPTAYCRAGTLVSIAANVSVLLGTMLLPIMPHYGNWIHEQCQAPIESRYLVGKQPKLVGWLRAGHKLGLVKPMFVKIEQEQFVTSMRARFG